jgi:hypothetical protein
VDIAHQELEVPGEMEDLDVAVEVAEQEQYQGLLEDKAEMD